MPRKLKRKTKGPGSDGYGLEGAGWMDRGSAGRGYGPQQGDCRKDCSEGCGPRRHTQDASVGYQPLLGHGAWKSDSEALLR